MFQPRGGARIITTARLGPAGLSPNSIASSSPVRHGSAHGTPIIAAFQTADDQNAPARWPRTSLIIRPPPAILCLRPRKAGTINRLTSLPMRTFNMVDFVAP